MSKFKAVECYESEPTAYWIAKDAGITTNTMYRWMADPTCPFSWTALAKLCRVLEVQPGDLLVFEAD